MVDFNNFRCDSRTFILGDYITTEVIDYRYRLVNIKDKSWDLKRQSELIQSILLRLSIGEFWFYHSNDKYLICIDGNKRLETLYSYMRGDFCLDHLVLIPEINGLKFSELSMNYQRRIKQSTIQVNYIHTVTDKEHKNELVKILRCQ